MRRHEVFTYSGMTKEGFTYVGAGISSSTVLREAQDAISRLNGMPLELTQKRTAYDLDRVLANKLKEISPFFIDAVGMSIKIDGVEGPTGGVIGNPNACIESADGQDEILSKYFSMKALPGGPGVVIKGSQEDVDYVMTGIYSGQGGRGVIHQILNKMEEHEIELGIVITDGTGTEYNGIVATFNKGQIEVVEIKD